MASQSVSIPPAVTDWPWWIQRGQKPPHHIGIYGARGSSICTIWTRDEEMAWANASLIRSAPELYDQLAKLVAERGADEAVQKVLSLARGERQTPPPFLK